MATKGTLDHEAGTVALTRANFLAEPARGRRLAGANVWIVVEALLARIPLRPDTGARVAGSPGSVAGIWINEPREVVVPSRTVTCQTKV